MAGAALERSLFKALCPRRYSGQSHPVLACGAHRPLGRQITHRSTHPSKTVNALPRIVCRISADISKFRNRIKKRPQLGARAEAIRGCVRAADTTSQLANPKPVPASFIRPPKNWHPVFPTFCPACFAYPAVLRLGRCQASCPCPGLHWHRCRPRWTSRSRLDWPSSRFRPSARCQE